MAFVYDFGRGGDFECGGMGWDGKGWEGMGAKGWDGEGLFQTVKRGRGVGVGLVWFGCFLFGRRQGFSRAVFF